MTDSITFPQLPRDVHVELFRYLTPADTFLVSSTCQQLRSIYRHAHWLNIAVYGYSQDTLKYVRSIPISVVLRPEKYLSWFPSGEVRYIYMNEEGCTLDDFLQEDVRATRFPLWSYPQLAYLKYTVAQQNLLVMRKTLFYKSLTELGCARPRLRLNVNVTTTQLEGNEFNDDDTDINNHAASLESESGISHATALRALADRPAGYWQQLAPLLRQLQISGEKIPEMPQVCFTTLTILRVTLRDFSACFLVQAATMMPNLKKLFVTIALKYNNLMSIEIPEGLSSLAKIPVFKIGIFVVKLISTKTSFNCRKVLPVCKREPGNAFAIPAVTAVTMQLGLIEYSHFFSYFSFPNAGMMLGSIYTHSYTDDNVTFDAFEMLTGLTIECSLLNYTTANMLEISLSRSKKICYVEIKVGISSPMREFLSYLLEGSGSFSRRQLKRQIAARFADCFFGNNVETRPGRGLLRDYSWATIIECHTLIKRDVFNLVFHPERVAAATKRTLLGVRAQVYERFCVVEQILRAVERIPTLQELDINLSDDGLYCSPSLQRMCGGLHPALWQVLVSFRCWPLPQAAPSFNCFETPMSVRLLKSCHPELPRTGYMHAVWHDTQAQFVYDLMQRRTYAEVDIEDAAMNLTV